MTTLRHEPVACALCGTETVVPIVNSTSSLGSPDLDLRPGPPASGSLFAWVQRCASCGYCASSIETGGGVAKEVVASPEYHAQLEDADIPELARVFLCAALIAEDGEEAEAARNAIFAAWACDDADATEAARRCRLRAVELIHESRAEGDELYNDQATESLVMVDLLRRAGHFDEAIAEADKALLWAEGELWGSLTYSRSLALVGDDATHTVDDVVAVVGAPWLLTAALKKLVAYGKDADYEAKSVVMRVDDARNYYVQFAVDEGGLFCEVVHNRYLQPEHAFTGDDIAKLLALGFSAPESEEQNLFCIFNPESDDDYEEIVVVVWRIVSEFFGMPPDARFTIETSW